MTALDVHGLRKAFGGVIALSGVDFSVAEGEVVALIGPNGAGKTTCFNILNGQLRPDAGSVRLFGRELVGLSTRRIWKLGVGRTFQVPATFPSLTVAEALQVAMLSHRQRLGRLFAANGAGVQQAATTLLANLGMADQADRPCGVLAYGDVKRVELALALANEPRLLLMDEPTAGTAPAEREALMGEVRRIAAEQRVSVLFTEHDVDVVFAHADRIIVLDGGTVIATGTPAAIRDDPLVRQVYLGEGAAGSRAGVADQP